MKNKKAYHLLAYICCPWGLARVCSLCVIGVALQLPFDWGIAATTSSNRIDSIVNSAKNPVGALDVLVKEGEQFYRKGNYEEAYAYFGQALTLATQIDDPNKQISIMINLGQICYYLSDHKQSLEHFHHVLELGKDNLSESKMAHIYSSLSDTYLALGDYNRAYEFQLKALEIRETIQDQEGIAKSGYGFGSIFFEQKHYEQALQKYLQSLQTWKELNNQQWILTTLTAIGTTYGSMGKWEQALTYDMEALKLAETLQDETNMAYILHSIGSNYADMGNYDSAEENLRKALQITQNTGNLQFEANVLESLGNVLVKSGKPELAIDPLTQAFQIASGVDAKSDVANICRSLAQAHHITGNENKAYYYLMQHTALKDSLLTGEMIDRMNNLQNSYEIQKREKEVALLTSQNKVKQLSLYGAAAGGLMLIFLLWMVRGRYKAEKNAKALLEEKNREIEVQNQKLAESNADLEQFAYVASHDLKEPLRMITGYASLIKKRYSKVFDESGNEFMHFIADAALRMDRLLDGLLDYSRVNRKNLGAKWVNLNDVVKVVNNNLQMRIKQSNARLYIGNLPTIKANYTQMVQLFQNLVGNALKFSQNSLPEVIVDCHIENEECVFMVKDNGIGIADENKDRIFQVFQRLHTQTEYEGSGVGLSITRKIVERYGGKIWVESEVGKGSTFFFTLPKAMGNTPAETQANTISVEASR